jgi:thiamine-monophosphate kinase
MGGVPKGFLISLGASGETPLEGLDEFTEEVSNLAHRYNLWPMGGDTFRSGRILVDFTVLGVVPINEITLQTSAKAGDAIWVTGELGSMRAAWTAQEDRRPGEEGVREKFWDPPARWPLLPTLRRTLPIRAMTDLSDGLSTDLRKILDREGLGAEIELGLLPIAPEARKVFENRGFSPLESAYAGGEDFELLIVEAGDAQTPAMTMIEGVPLTRIGRVTGEGGSLRTTLSGKEHKVRTRGFEHF